MTKGKVGLFMDREFTPPIVILGRIEDLLEGVHSQTKKLLKREPSIDEYKEKIYGKTWEAGDREGLYLIVDTLENTKEVLIEEFTKIIKAMKKDPSHVHRDARLSGKPTTRIRLDELTRYLQIYDLWKQGHKMKEIVATIDPNNISDDAHVLRAFRRDLSKAKKIIKNVEQGHFPGDY